MLEPQDRLMGLGLPDGGHLTHGYYVGRFPPTFSTYFSNRFPRLPRKR